MLNILKAIGFTIARSELILSATPGYWIFTASFFPSFVARCTWPMLAALTDWVANVSNISSVYFPLYFLKVFLTRGADRGGTLNWARENFSTFALGKMLFSIDSI